ncbi:DNA internalization-related competence protein ComEC/Rec2 [Wenzhouxiangella limi]|uniref:DNA internalization-related competence protein ComEC/Rec2 n=1 Tax=Wenzhouxiangella limi TaxID=2707351 RepID=A0A845UVN4_9GAMM|nr:DNA internalization-related competence protein ComEC/Rec2 [Wenzhouxiangella limi]NDY94648.1 DNA internalization-related competence protein ComEC/Rec2 [Wenzhouxiangella limi]
MDWRHGFAFAAGALIAVLSPALPPPWLLGVLGAFSLLAAIRFRPARMPAALVLGGCWFLVHAHFLLAESWPADRAGSELPVSGRIAGLPERQGDRLRFMLVPDGAAADELPGRIQVTWYRPREYLRPGQRWRFDLRLDPPAGRLNPGAFDLTRHLLSLGVGATASVQGGAERLATAGWRGAVDRKRQYLAERLQAETTDLDNAALLRALGLADRTAISPELRELLQRTGTAHLLAISGLHIGMVAGLAGFLGGWLLSPLLLFNASLDRRRLAVVAGLAAGLGYAWLAGFTLPTVRALIMLAVAGTALSLRRGVQPAHALLLALLAVLLLDPMAPLATGFWLSFSAVAVLVWAFAWRPSRVGQGWLRGLVLTQLVIGIGLLPLNIGVFQQWIPGALPANLIAIPLVGFWILPLLLATLLTMMLGLPSDWLIAALEPGLQLLLSLLEWLNAQAWTNRHVAGAGLFAVILAVVGALWLMAPPGWPARWLGAFLLLPLVLPADRKPDASVLELTMFDVGDGQAVLLESDGQRVLFDTGPGDGEGRDAISRLLPGAGSSRFGHFLDGVVVARGHRGHAGGLATAAGWSHPLRVRVAPGLGGSDCRQGEVWPLGRYRLRFLHPSPALPDLGDNSSCVLLIDGPGGRALLTGGIDHRVENRLLVDYPRINADLLVLSAGGHRRAASAPFLDRLSPQLALASVDRHDRFGRPHQEIVERLERRGTALLTTGRCGALQVRMAPDQPPRVRTERGRRRQFWHDSYGCP